MQKSSLALIACLTLICLMLTGCNGGRETDEVAWVISMGVDKAGDELEITYRVAVPRALAGEAGGGGEKKETTSLITVRASSLAEGRNLVNTAISRAISLSQVRVIVISEELARAGVQDLLGPLVRFREFRGSIFVLVCKGSAKETFAKNMPPLESLTSRWVENYAQSAQEVSYYPMVSLHEFYLRLKNASGSPYSAYYALNPLTGQGRPSGGRFDGEATEEYLPGYTPRSGGNPAEVLGMAVFKEDKMVDVFDTEQTRAFLILQNKLSRNFLVVKDPLAPPHTVNIAIRNGSTPKIKVDTSGETPVISIDAFIEGEISALPSGIPYETKEYRTLLEAQISRVLTQHIKDMLAKTQALGADVFDFGYYIRGKFSTIQQMNAYHWDNQYPHAQINVTVKTEIRRTGLMQRSNPIRRE